jgi:L-lactate dehydrogenase (cytochrome)
VDSQFDPSVTWKDLDWVRANWKGRILLKGILDPEDAREAARNGVDGIVVSNHGGRQLDGAPAAALALPPIVDAVGSSLEVLVDGGVRSGLDLLKYLALGARACMLGRPWAWALAARGQAGVAAVLRTIRSELEVGMGLVGATRVADLDSSILAKGGRS